MNLVQLEFFHALATTLNYTKASKILHTTQPNLSKSIMALEEEVGVQLFARSKRTVSLTAAGEVFHRETEKVMVAYNTAVVRAREAEEGVSGSITIGFLGTAMGEVLPKIVLLFREMYPEISLNLKDYTYSALMDALISDRVDVAFIPDLELTRIPDVERKFIYGDDMCLTVSREHPLAERAEIDLYEAKDEYFVMMDPKISALDNNLMQAICLDQDFIPKSVYEANTLNNLLLMVGCNVGVSILASHMRRFATDRVSFVNIKGYQQYFRIAAAWRAGRKPTIPLLVQVIDRAMATD